MLKRNGEEIGRRDYPVFTRYACQILQAPSWLTMQGPMGVRGVQPFP